MLPYRIFSICLQVKVVGLAENIFAKQYWNLQVLLEQILQLFTSPRTID